MIKLGLYLIFVSIALLAGCSNDKHYEDGMREYQAGQYEKALESFNRVSEDDEYFQDSQVMIMNIDSTLSERKRLEEKQDSIRQAQIIYENRPWKKNVFVDEFGVKTGSEYILTSVEGDFSNTATHRSDLFVNIIVTNRNVGILLYEYSKDRPAVKFIGSGSIMLRNSINERVTVETVREWGQSGGLLVGGIHSSNFKRFIENSEGEIQVVIQDNYSSIYRFSIDATGFEEEYEKLQ